MIIPIGIDCQVADILRKYKLRKFAFPFDWVVTYKGVSNIFKNNFNNYLPKNDGILILDKESGILFVHNLFPKDNDKLTKRINRLNNILETTKDKVTFIKKGHTGHQHDEHDGFFDKIDDINDVIQLDKFLKNKYPKLKFEIILALKCGKCYKKDLEYKVKSKNIKIYNIAANYDNKADFERLIKKIYNLNKICIYNNLCFDSYRILYFSIFIFFIIIFFALKFFKFI